MKVTVATAQARRRACRPYLSTSAIAKCLAKFSAEPERYLKPARSRRAAARSAPGTIYTCPMHPEVRQTGPGSCPICGMALEPEAVDRSTRAQRGAGRLHPPAVGRRGAHRAGRGARHGRAPAACIACSALSAWIQLLFATPVVLWAGWPFFVRGAQSVVARSAQHVHPDRARHRRGLPLQRRRHVAPGLFPLASRCDGRSRSISKRRRSSSCWCCWARCWSCARASAPAGADPARCSTWRRSTALRVGADGSDEEVALDAGAVGDRLRVRPGEKVPVDGAVTEGRGAVDEVDASPASRCRSPRSPAPR